MLTARDVFNPIILSLIVVDMHSGGLGSFGLGLIDSDEAISELATAIQDYFEILDKIPEGQTPNVEFQEKINELKDKNGLGKIPTSLKLIHSFYKNRKRDRKTPFHKVYKTAVIKYKKRFRAKIFENKIENSNIYKKFRLDQFFKKK